MEFLQFLKLVLIAFRNWMFRSQVVTAKRTDAFGFNLYECEGIAERHARILHREVSACSERGGARAASPAGHHTGMGCTPLQAGER